MSRLAIVETDRADGGVDVVHLHPDHEVLDQFILTFIQGLGAFDGPDRSPRFRSWLRTMQEDEELLELEDPQAHAVLVHQRLRCGSPVVEALLALRVHRDKRAAA